MNRSASLPLLNPLHWEVQKVKCTYSPPWDLPFWAPFMFPRALDTQAASVLSRSSKLCTGGPVWPAMSPSMFVDAQSVPSPKLHSLPAGKLVPLPIPRHPCSHVRVDFVTGLPNSEGFTYILIAGDRFSKACKLITLCGLPTALETAEAPFHHLFRTFGNPEDVVSDRGPQFISRVWKAFFKLLDVTVCLSSGYHPQTNGQTEQKIQEIGRL